MFTVFCGAVLDTPELALTGWYSAVKDRAER